MKNKVSWLYTAVGGSTNLNDLKQLNMRGTSCVIRRVSQRSGSLHKFSLRIMLPHAARPKRAPDCALRCGLARMNIYQLRGGGGGEGGVGGCGERSPG